MIDVHRLFFGASKHTLYAFLFFDKRAGRFLKRSVVQINVRDLMVGDGKNFARAAIEQLEAEFFLDRKPAFGSEQPVEMDRPIHRCDSIFGEQNYLNGLSPEKLDQLPNDRIYRPQI